MRLGYFRFCVVLFISAGAPLDATGHSIAAFAQLPDKMSADQGSSSADALHVFPPDCPEDTTRVGFECASLALYNSGAIGNMGIRSDLIWNCGQIGSLDPIFTGSFVLAGRLGASGVIFRTSAYWEIRMFIPNTAPQTGACGFDRWDGVPLGFTRAGGCPGTPSPVSGTMVTSSYRDTLPFPSAVHPASAGVSVIQTVVSTSTAPYGDFVLYRWEIINRDNLAKGPWHAGTFIDWDVGSASNTGRYSDAANCYYVWDPGAPEFAFGALDPNQPSRYGEVSASFSPPHRIEVRECFWFFWECWGMPYEEDLVNSWQQTVTAMPFRRIPLFPEDVVGVLINAPFHLPPNGSAVIHQALFYVDASSNNPAVIEQNAVSVARRAARWAGFARGDVNDDGLVDLADVAWLVAGLPIYPDTYSGDVDIDGDVDVDDLTYLLNFVSGMGPPPLGAWRIELPL